jgi:hypothetical protein
MPASLSPAQIARYQRDGFLAPLGCLTPQEVRHFRGRLEDFEREQGDTFGRLPDWCDPSRACCSPGWTNWCVTPRC